MKVDRPPVAGVPLDAFVHGGPDVLAALTEALNRLARTPGGLALNANDRYVLLAGTYPFAGASNEEMFTNIKTKKHQAGSHTREKGRSWGVGGLWGGA